MSEIETLFARYFDDGDATALAQACTLAQRESVDIASLLDWVQRYAAEPAAIQHALGQLRRALGLRPIPGAVCRPQP